ncbi:aromatic amino acid aminotransferase [Clohesyomyces aquaticus]|uniref:Aromatic amino acid aminotransferase n=1 Tax=Clohesyomyces aquaticus TaxID=1231657 RepID=A0A1Y1YV12_9PLEO|nr:aromatic amino acid aminotransferase [Clohesyomyces aquaticus]
MGEEGREQNEDSCCLFRIHLRTRTLSIAMQGSKAINLQLGWPSPSLFPSSQILQGASNVLTSSKSATALVYGPDAGYEPLRGSIASWLSSVYGYGPTNAIDQDRICITNGASANLAAVLSKFTEPGYTRNIWMIEPSYFLACPIFMDAGFEGRMKGVPEDPEGLDIDFLRRGLQACEEAADQQAPKLKTGTRYQKLYKHILYLVPTYSNPSGKTMSLRRRQQLVQLAREFDALVITDDVYDTLRWSQDENDHVSQLGAVPPRIVDIDRSLDGGPKEEWGNAMSNGSFSKIIAPGIRVGWAEATPSFALALSQVGSTRSGGCPTQLAASFVHEMLDSGSLEKHLKQTVIPTFRSRYYAMIKAIETHLIPLGFSFSSGIPYNSSSPANTGETNGKTNGHGSVGPDAGGYFLYIMLPVDFSTRGSELAALALKEHNLKFAYGDMFRIEGDAGSAERGGQGFGRGIRLSWAWHPSEEISEGIQRLAKIIQDLRSKET